MLFYAVFCYFAFQNKEGDQEIISVIKGLSQFISCEGNSGYRARWRDLDLSDVQKRFKEGLPS
jgi:hypothetical protein